MQNLPSNRTGQESTKRSITMRRHHDQVDLVLVSIIDNHLCGVAFLDHAGQDLRRETPRHETVHRFRGPFPNFLSQNRIEAPGVSDFREK
jgi:hypothetical protein